MSVAAGPPAEAVSAKDRRVLIIGIVCVAISVVTVLGNVLHLMPSALAVGIVFGALGIGFRVLLMWTAKSASPERREKVLGLLSWVGLGLAGVTFVGLLPRLTAQAGFGTFLSDLFAHAWTIGLLTIAAGLVRTMSWKAFLGAGLSGFFGVPALSRLVGVPIVALLGEDSAIAVAFWVPLTEEVLKLAPVALVVVLAIRKKTDARPSAMDLALMGAWSGAGFALYENGLYGRGGFKFDAFPISLFNPNALLNDNGGFAMLAAGHMLWSALAALGLGIGLLYLKRGRLIWLAAPIGLGLAVLEHATVNATGLSLFNGGFVEILARIGTVVTLGGWLSALVMIAGTTLAVLLEWKHATRIAPDPAAPKAASMDLVKRWLLVPPKTEGRRRSGQLAAFQYGPTAGGER